MNSLTSYGIIAFLAAITLMFAGQMAPILSIWLSATALVLAGIGIASSKSTTKQGQIKKY